MKRNVLKLAVLTASLATTLGASAAGAAGSDMRLAQAYQQQGAEVVREPGMQVEQGRQGWQQQNQELGVDAAREQGMQAQQDQNQVQGGRQNQQRQAQGGQNPNAAVLMVMPLQAENQQTMNNGCWARLYDGRNFTGSQLTLVGPVELQNVDVPGRLGWASFDSAIIGPNARVFTYDDANYQDQTAILNPGQRIIDLDERKLGWMEEIESVIVRCAQ